MSANPIPSETLALIQAMGMLSFVFAVTWKALSWTSRSYNADKAMRDSVVVIVVATAMGSIQFMIAWLNSLMLEAGLLPTETATSIIVSELIGITGALFAVVTAVSIVPGVGLSASIFMAPVTVTAVMSLLIFKVSEAVVSFSPLLYQLLGFSLAATLIPFRLFVHAGSQISAFLIVAIALFPLMAPAAFALQTYLLLDMSAQPIYDAIGDAKERPWEIANIPSAALDSVLAVAVTMIITTIAWPAIFLFLIVSSVARQVSSMISGEQEWDPFSSILFGGWRGR